MPAATFRGSRPLFIRRRAFASASEKKTMLEGRLRQAAARAAASTPYRNYCDYLFGPDGLREEKIPLHRCSDHEQDRLLPRAETFRLSRPGRRCREMTALRRRSASAAVERGLFFGRRALHAGDGAERICRDSCRIPLSHSGHRYFDPGAGRAEMAVYSTDVVEPVPQPMRRKYLMRSREAECRSRAHRAGAAPAGGVSPAELHGLRLRADREGRRDLLPQRHHLLRPADAGEDTQKADASAEAGRLSFRRATRKPCTT